MALALAEKYSSLSLHDCLSAEEKPHRSGLLGNPLVDLPLSWLLLAWMNIG